MHGQHRTYNPHPNRGFRSRFLLRCESAEHVGALGGRRNGGRCEISHLRRNCLGLEAGIQYIAPEFAIPAGPPLVAEGMGCRSAVPTDRDMRARMRAPKRCAVDTSRVHTLPDNPKTASFAMPYYGGGCERCSTRPRMGKARFKCLSARGCPRWPKPRQLSATQHISIGYRAPTYAEVTQKGLCDREA